MPEMLKAGLIRSLATAPIARIQPPRESRTDDAFSSHLDTARDAIRESRRNERSERMDKASKRKDDARDAADAKKVDDAKDPRVDQDVVADDSTVAVNTVAAPIVVVTTGAPDAFTADADIEPEGEAGEQFEDAATTSPEASVDSNDGTLSKPTRAAAASSGPAHNEGDPLETQPVPSSIRAIKPESQSNPATQAVVRSQSIGQNDVATDGSPLRLQQAATGNARELSTAVANIQDVGDAKASADVPQTQATVAQAAAEQDFAPRIGREAQRESVSLRDIRVAASLDRALGGDSSHAENQDAGARQGDSAHGQPKSLIAGVANDSTRPGPARVNNAIDSTVRVTGISEVSGDVTAATIGRFLLDAPATTGRTGAQAPSGASSDAAMPARGETSAMSSPTIVSQGVATKSAATPALREPAGATFSQILATRLNPSDAIDGAARTLAASGGNGRHQVTLRLAPAELGQLRLDVRMEQGVMSLRVDADNAAAGRMIESRLGELREALAVHGISVERAEVVVRGDTSANLPGDQRQHHEDQHTRQHASNGDSGESNWNFSGDASFAQGGRGERSDANSWWSVGESMSAAVEASPPEATQAAGATAMGASNLALDLVA